MDPTSGCCIHRANVWLERWSHGCNVLPLGMCLLLKKNLPLHLKTTFLPVVMAALGDGGRLEVPMSDRDFREDGKLE